MAHKRYSWGRTSDGLEFEVRQLKDEGRALDAAFERDAAQTLLMEDGVEKDRRAAELFARGQALPFLEGKDVEPSAYRDIARLSKGAARKEYDADKLYDRVYGGWLARCAGCLLGKPIEGWSRQMIAEVAQEQENYPVSTYLTSRISEALMKKYENSPLRDRAYIDKVDGMPEDDDTNYTIIGMKLLENCGRDFTPDDVADLWLRDLPYLHLCTAERVAYRNYVTNHEIPETATYCNAYREWIGAQIRADIFGYVNPGDPVAAAEMAWRDACFSHVKNGIYGEMWAAAMIAEGFVNSDPKSVIRAGLAVVPQESRLVSAIEDVLAWHEEGVQWETALERICARWDEKCGHDWCHTISNAQIVAAALLFGGGDLEKTLSIAVMPGFDTDCNAATAGSVLGVMLGAEALPEKWIAPLNDTLYSGVDGFQKTAISELARRTVKLVK